MWADDVADICRFFFADSSVLAAEALDNANLRVLEMQLISDLEQQICAAELLLVGKFYCLYDASLSTTVKL